jgi:Helix-turn-helix domain
MEKDEGVSDWGKLPGSHMFKIKEVAAILRISESEVRNIRDAGILGSFRLRGTGRGPTRFRKDEVVEYLRSCRSEPTTPRREQTPRQGVGKPFKHLDDDRLLAAWRRADDHNDSPDEHAAL